MSDPTPRPPGDDASGPGRADDAQEALAQRIEELARRGRAEEARALIDAPPPVGAAARAQLERALARGLFRARDPAGCLAILDDQADRWRREPAAVHLTVQALLELGETRQARRTAERHLVRHPTDQIARRLLSRTREVAPRAASPDPLTSLSRVQRLVRRGHLEEARQVLRALAVDAPDDPRVMKALRLVDRRLDAERSGMDP